MKTLLMTLSVMFLSGCATTLYPDSGQVIVRPAPIQTEVFFGPGYYSPHYPYGVYIYRNRIYRPYRVPRQNYRPAPRINDLRGR